ncbi:MAG: glycine--tRNA ligase subunit beta [Candidatus Cloacimonetes bacterium]|nr:glycine--tRNA ligase subunit beta [Candidatus Cloacimonadota bacterium]
MHSFLFELGTEELPDNVILPAIEYLGTALRKTLQSNSLGFTSLYMASTPRRLALIVGGLPACQEDAEIVKIGPAISIAYTAQGELSPAGLGFLKKTGASANDIFTEHSAKGDFLAVRFVQKGLATLDILKEWIPTAIMQMPLPKRMIWNDRALGFSRPIRWILALWDDTVIDVDFYTIKASRYSFGNRYLNLEEPVLVRDCDHYEKALLEARVVVNRDQRRAMITEQMDSLFAGEDFRVVKDERLLETVCNLVEYPTAVVGSFDADFLRLPEKIITSTISQNQKYFSVYDGDGKLANKFVFISNGDPQHSGIIRAGNEKVVRARLEDAMWFFTEDSKKPLDNYCAHLSEVVFQSQLGTLADKTDRLLKLSAYICDSLSFPQEIKNRALRTAQLCKADLVTLMLGEKEFTKLQGYIGKQYAMVSGEDPEVAEGIYEHYMPRGSNDTLPQSLSGAICAVADKLDTVAGIIGIGMMPTGSADPFALRRAAGGIVQILAARKWQVDLTSLIEHALHMLSDKVQLKAEAEDNVKSFFAQRVVWLLKESGIAYDVVAAVMQTSYASLDDLIAKAKALDALKKEESFIRLVIGFKRVANIIADVRDFGATDSALLEPGAEQDLFTGLSSLRAEIGQALVELDYASAFRHLVAFGIRIDNFFDDVLVNCEDARLRANRYALLAEVRAEFLRVADISLIVVDNEIGE